MSENEQSIYEILQKNRRNLKVIYNTLMQAKNSGNFELINNFINYIKSSGIRYTTDKLILFAFDQTYRTDENYRSIQSDIERYSIDQLNIAFIELNRFKPLTFKEREYFSMVYERVLEGFVEDGIINETTFEEKVKLEYLVPETLAYFLLELYDSDKELYQKAIQIIKQKYLRLELSKLDGVEIFNQIEKQVYCYGIPLFQLKELLANLQLKLNLTDINLDDFNTCYKIYCYYQETNDPSIPQEFINKIRMKIPIVLDVNLKVLPPKTKLEIGIISQDELNAFIEYFNRTNRDDISIVFDFKTIEECPNLYNLLKTFKNQDNIILSVYKERKKDGFITLADYIKAHNFYEVTAEAIKEYNFTPLEQYIYVYNLVKSFKQYRKYADDNKKDQKYSELSRNPYIIIGNSYIVCAGFTGMGSILLNLLSIKATDLTVTLSDEIYDNPFHSRLLAYIKDDTYGIDGVFTGDPTFDALGVSDFGHMLMTKKGMEDIKKDAAFIEEFRKKVLELGIDYDVFLDPEQEKQLFDQNVNSVVLLQAFRNVLIKTNPSMSPQEIDKQIEQIFNTSGFEGYVPNIDLNTNLAQYVTENDNLNLTNYFYHYLGKDLHMYQFGTTRGTNAPTVFAFKLRSDSLSPQEINEYLKNNLEQITNSYVSYGINETFPSENSIMLTFPQETRIGDMIAIVQELSNNLNQIFVLNMERIKR